MDRASLNLGSGNSLKHLVTGAQFSKQLRTKVPPLAHYCIPTYMAGVEGPENPLLA